MSTDTGGVEGGCVTSSSINPSRIQDSVPSSFSECVQFLEKDNQGQDGRTGLSSRDRRPGSISGYASLQTKVSLGGTLDLKSPSSQA